MVRNQDPETRRANLWLVTKIPLSEVLKSRHGVYERFKEYEKWRKPILQSSFG